ncbi:hypothetical protein BV898_14819 [Hypsibius exemplaris]|uniref:Cadherin domain-containing protein n=1 Tax=Hypsibius exemplaris TaxID=2072580 RepID=A0A9X6N9G7_HYPEX|nr:hypothetical protein BV898_14819 [Hypsibius exemplaris]
MGAAVILSKLSLFIGLAFAKDLDLHGACDQSVYIGNVLENAHPGTFILRVSAHDLTPLEPLWSIPDASLREFAVDTETGDISLFKKLHRVRSGMPTAKKARWIFQFQVLARDKNSRKKLCQSSVRVNVVPVSFLPVPGNVTASSRQIIVDEPSVILGGSPGYNTQTQQQLSQYFNPTSGFSFTQGNYQFTVLACVPGALVGQLAVQSSIYSPVTFTLANGNFYYGIVPQTGAITIQNLPPPGLQTLLVTAQTTNGFSTSVPVTITSTCGGVGNGINALLPGSSTFIFGDNVAFAQPSYQFTSSACTAGSVIGMVLAQSNGQSVTYSIPAGNTFFAVNPGTGLLSTTLAPPGGTWSQTFVVAATSVSGRTTSVSVTVTNTCSNPGGFTQPSYNYYLDTCAAGSVVGSVYASAGVTGGVAYSIPNGNPYFAINPATGQITIIQAPPLGMQSFSTQSISSSGQISTAVCTVTVAPGPPTFPGTFYSFTLSNCIAGATVGQVSATSCGNAVAYSLGGNDNPYYTINQLTGQLSVLNIPPPGTQTLLVQATSSNGLSLTVPVVISSPCGGGQYNVMVPYGGQMSLLGQPYRAQELPPYSYYQSGLAGFNGGQSSLGGSGSGNNYLNDNVVPYIK